MTPLHSSWKVVSRRPTTGDLTPQILSGANEFIQKKEITVAAVKADLDSLRELYNTLKTDVETANNIQKQTDSSLASTVWESTNATQFRAAWEEFKPKLMAFEETFATAASDVAQNHNNLAISNGENVEHLSPVSPIG